MRQYVSLSSHFVSVWTHLSPFFHRPTKSLCGRYGNVYRWPILSCLRPLLWCFRSEWDGHHCYSTTPCGATLQWRHNEHDGVSNHQPDNCLLNRLFRRRSKKTWKLRVTGLCERNSPVTGEFPAQRASYVENFSIWWCHHETAVTLVHYWWSYSVLL